MRSPDFRHLLNLLTREGPQEPVFIEEILEVIGLGTDARGTALFGTPSYDVINGAVGVNTLDGLVVPAGRLFWVPYAEVYHNDGAAAHHLTIAINHAGATTVAVANSHVNGVTNGESLSLPRTVVVPGGANVRALCGDGVGAGNNLFLRYMYFEIAPGGYAFPW